MKQTDNHEIPFVHTSGDIIASELWRELKRLACEDALVRQLRHDKASRRHLFRKQFGPFGEEK